MVMRQHGVFAVNPKTRIFVCMFMDWDVVLQFGVRCFVVCHTLNSEQKQKQICSDAVLVFAFCSSPGALLQFSFFFPMCGIRRIFCGRAGTFQKEGGWGRLCFRCLCFFLCLGPYFSVSCGFPCC